MKINYGLWWYEQEGKKKVRRSKNFSIDHEMNWDDQNEHEKFRKMIIDKHPGTHIIGYAQAN